VQALHALIMVRAMTTWDITIVIVMPAIPAMIAKLTSTNALDRAAPTTARVKMVWQHLHANVMLDILEERARQTSTNVWASHVLITGNAMIKLTITHARAMQDIVG
jgi:hypothetical protein